MDKRKQSNTNIGSKMMMACCLAMAAGFVIYLVAGGTIMSAETLLPLALCLGVHFILFKFLGVSCHKPDSDQENSNSGELVKNVSKRSSVPDTPSRGRKTA